MAFSPWTRATLTVLVKVPLAFITEYTGLRAAWNEDIVGHSALERKGQQKLEWIYNRQKRKEDKKKTEEDKDKEMVRKGGIELLKERSCSAHHNVYAH